MRVLVLFLAVLVTDSLALAQSPDPYELQRQMQQQYYDNQLEQARIQANGMALFGSGQALINGMNQGFQNMQQPRYDSQPFVPVVPINPVRPTVQCYATNPGAMQSVICR